MSAKNSKPTSQTFEVTLTPGNLRNGHVYIRTCSSFFPEESFAGRLRNGEPGRPIVLLLEGMGPIETDIDPGRGIFRWQGWKKLFQPHGLSADDKLVFSKIGPRRFAEGSYFRKCGDRFGNFRQFSPGASR